MTNQRLLWTAAGDSDEQWQEAPTNWRLDSNKQRPDTPMNGSRRFQRNSGRKFRWTRTGGSEEQWLDAPMNDGRRLLQPLTNGGWRFQRNGGLKFRRTRAGGSKEPRPDVPTNSGRMFRQTAAGASNERRSKISKKRRPEVPTYKGRRLRWMHCGNFDLKNVIWIFSAKSFWSKMKKIMTLLRTTIVFLLYSLHAWKGCHLLWKGWNLTPKCKNVSRI